MKWLRWQIILLLSTSLLLTYCSTDDAADFTVEEDEPVVEIDSLETDVPEPDSIAISEDELYFQEMEGEHLHFDSANVMNVVFIGENYFKQDLLRDESRYREEALLQFDY